MRKSRGMSLVEILIAMSVLTVTLTVFSSMFTSQQRVSAQLADKLASLDLARTLTATLAGGNVCSFMINNAPPYSFDPMNLTAVNIPPFTEIPSRAIAGATPAVQADGTALASPNSPRLVANSIRIANLSCAVQPCTPTSSQFNAQMIVNFDPARVAGPVSPLVFPIVLTTTGPAGNQTLSSCTMNAGGGGGGTIDRTLVTATDFSCTGPNPNCLAAPAPSIATCPAGYEVSGCGFELGPWPDPVAAASGGDPTGDYLTNAPGTVVVDGNGCRVVAGYMPGCNVCFRAQAVCIRVQ